MPTNPVNSLLPALYRFQSYIASLIRRESLPAPRLPLSCGGSWRSSLTHRPPRAGCLPAVSNRLTASGTTSVQTVPCRQIPPSTDTPSARTGRQSFTDSFREMYKKAPNRYRKEEEFYPLQLRYVLQESPADLEGENGWQQRIACATAADIPAWMEPVRLVIDGFPHLDEERYFARLRVYIRNGRALILKDGDTTVGIMAFDEMTGDRLSGGASAIPEKRRCQGACAVTAFLCNRLLLTAFSLNFLWKRRL